MLQLIFTFTQKAYKYSLIAIYQRHVRAAYFKSVNIIRKHCIQVEAVSVVLDQSFSNILIPRPHKM